MALLCYFLQLHENLHLAQKKKKKKKKSLLKESQNPP